MDAVASSETYSSSVAEADVYARWILAHFAPYLMAPIVEVGLGHGGFVGQLLPLGSYAGLDIDPESVSQAQAKYPDARLITADITRLEQLTPIGLGQARTVLCCNVLEHVQDDRQGVSNLLALLAPGGHLLMQVPAHPLLYNDLDRLAHHHLRYGRQRLLQPFAGQPAEVLSVEFFNPIGFFGWLANRFVSHQSLNGASVSFQTRLFVNHLLPLSRLLTPLTRHFFGQSLMLVAKKI
ncbi:MAG: class I SAM-dependent methyltransferase [Magnetococcales bacterium]|nr:class I SAM-dependent methyltransferase [Magnetococcales bacterium]